MERQAFKAFTAKALEEVIQLAEAELKVTLPRPPRFQWLGKPLVESEDVAEAIVERIWLASNQIHPCVDIGVAALDQNGRPLVVAAPSGHRPTEFGRSWTGREGPFNHFLGGPLLNGERRNSIPIGAAFGYSVVPLKRTR